MSKKFGLIVLCLSVVGSAFGALKQGDWIASGGMGMTADPSSFLLTPQAEYVYRPNVFFGPLVQLGFGAGGTLFTGSAAGRLVLGRHPQMRPNVEGGLGIAAASGKFDSSIGVLMHLGVGFDYMLSPTLSVGTTFRANLAPPLKGFFLSWPIIQVRTAI